MKLGLKRSVALSLAAMLVLARAVSAQTGPSPAVPNRATDAASSPTLTDLSATHPTSGVFFNGAGAYIGFCSVTGCVPGPHLRTQGYLTLSSALNAWEAQEINLHLDLATSRGYVQRWAPNTAYATGDVIISPENFSGEIYEAAGAGTSGPSPTGFPKGGGDVVDGTVRWAHRGPYPGSGFSAGKSNLSVATRATPGAGSTWGIVANTVRAAGVKAQVYGQEFDCTNEGDPAIVGQDSMTCLFFGGQGTGSNPMLAYILVSSSNPDSHGAKYGILFNNRQSVQDVTFADGSSSAVSFRALDGRTHQQTFRDDATAGTSYMATGPKGTGIDLTGATFSTAYAMTLPASSYLGFSGTGQALGYDARSGCLTYGTTNSPGGYLFAACNDGRFLTNAINQLPVVTVASLPACGTSGRGSYVAVSDAAAPAWNARLKGGGSSTVIAFCNGAEWTAH